MKHPIDIGTALREARERRGIALRDIAAATNISLHVLQTIERGDIARVPGGIFTRAYLRAYSAEVGLDPEEIVRAYRSQHEAADEEDEIRALRVRVVNRGPRPVDWIRPLLLVAVLAFVFYRLFFSSPGESRTAGPPPELVPAGYHVLPSTPLAPGQITLVD